MTKREARILALKHAASLLANPSIGCVEEYDWEYSEEDARKIRDAIKELADQLYDKWKNLEEKSAKKWRASRAERAKPQPAEEKK
jgi:hypothetical protein